MGSYPTCQASKEFQLAFKGPVDIEASVGFTDLHRSRHQGRLSYSFGLNLNSGFEVRAYGLGLGMRDEIGGLSRVSCTACIL